MSAGRLEELATHAAGVTPLRAVAARVLQMAEDERTAALDLATAISADPVLTAKLLKIANSAYYGFSRRISTVREAVILLGMRSVRSLVIASGVIDAFPGRETPGFSQDLFWAHSVCVGLAAEGLARAGRGSRPEDAFTAGVLHDVGRLAMQLSEPVAFGAAVQLVLREGKSFLEAERTVFGFGHDEAGAALAEAWHFPAQLIGAIRLHRAADEAGAGSLAATIAQADAACNAAGLACGFDWTAPIPAAALEEEALPGSNASGMPAIERKARAFLQNVTGRPPAWYATGRMAADPPEEGASSDAA